MKRIKIIHFSSLVSLIICDKYDDFIDFIVQSLLLPRGLIVCMSEVRYYLIRTQNEQNAGIFMNLY